MVAGCSHGHLYREDFSDARNQDQTGLSRLDQNGLAFPKLKAKQTGPYRTETGLDQTGESVLQYQSTISMANQPLVSTCQCQLAIVNCQLAIATWQLPIRNCQIAKLPFANCRLQIASWQLAIGTLHLELGNVQLPIATCHLPVTNCHLPITNCHLAIAKCQWAIANGQLPLENGQLAIVKWTQFPIANWTLPTGGFYE